jgi:hypothetical protein
MPCGSFVVVGGKRCRLHGGLSTGPVTLLGKLRCAENMRRVRINGPGPGHHKTEKARRRRETRARRERMWAKRQERKRLRAIRWQQKQRLKNGLPLLTEAELENL